MIKGFMDFVLYRYIYSAVCYAYGTYGYKMFVYVTRVPEYL